MKLLRVVALFIIAHLELNAQNISLNKSTYDETGQAGLVLTPMLKVENTGVDTVEVFVNRYYQNLPSGWTSCFCFIECQAPTVSTLQFKVAPGQTADIGVSFHTDSIEGIGYINLTVEEMGGSFKDTLYFSGSTLTSGIKTNGNKGASFNYFPNPVRNELTLSSTSKDINSISILSNTGGIIIRDIPVNNSSNKVNLEQLTNGLYYLKVTYASGKSEFHPIIKCE